METLIVLCLALSSSFAAPQLNQLYTPPNLQGSNQSQNPRLPNPLPTNSNNAFLQNTQSTQASSTITRPIQQGKLSMQMNQDLAFSSQKPVDTQNPTIFRPKDTIETKNEYGHSYQSDLPEVNNSGNDIFNTGSIRTPETPNGQLIPSGIETNNNLNNQGEVERNVDNIRQSSNNQVLPDNFNRNSNGQIVDNVDHNGNNVNILLENGLPGLQLSSKENKQYTYGNTGVDGNIQSLSSSQNGANGVTNDVSSKQPNSFQNNEQSFSHQNLNSEQNFNNNAQVGKPEGNFQNKAGNQNNDFIIENTQTHGQSNSQQNSNSNQNVDNNSNVNVQQNLEVTNEKDINQGTQNSNGDQRGVIANEIKDHQKNELRSQCSRGLLLDARGNCVRPEVSRNVYVYRAPKMSQNFKNTSVEIPKPKLEYNIVFVRTPERKDIDGEPIVVPPPQQKTLVYVLSKKKADGTQKIITVPSGPKHDPEVYYVNYNEGDNPTLPGGIDLQTALSAATQTGQSVNEVLNESLLREDVSQVTVGSLSEDETGIQNAFGNNPGGAITFTSSNNDEHASNQFQFTNNNNDQSLNTNESNNGFINNHFEQNFETGFPSLSATQGVSQQNVGTLNGQLLPLEGLTQQGGRFKGQHSAEGNSPQDIGSLNGAPLSAGYRYSAPEQFENSGNVINKRNTQFVTNNRGYSLRQLSAIPTRQYNAYY